MTRGEILAELAEKIRNCKALEEASSGGDYWFWNGKREAYEEVVWALEEGEDK